MDIIFSNTAKPHNERTGSWLFFLITAFILSGCASPTPQVTHRQPETLPPVAPAEQTVPSTPSPVQLEVEQETAAKPSTELTRDGEPATVPPVTMDDIASSIRTIDYIEQRLIIYEKKFQQWLERHPQDDTDTNQWSVLTSDTCLDKFNALLSGYTNLRNRLQLTALSADTPIPRNTIREMLQLDIAFLESDCDQGLSLSASLAAQDYPQGTDPVQGAHHAESTIDTYFNEEQYDQVITIFQLFTETYPTIAPSLQSLKQYGLAQLHGGDIDEATDALSQALALLETNSRTIEPWALRRLLADLHLASGKPNEARKVYEMLVASSDSYTQSYSWATRQLALLGESSATDPRMTYYLDLLRAALVFHMNGQSPMDLMAKADRIAQLFPNTPVADNAIWIKQEIENQLREWTDEQFRQVAVLTKEKEFQQALTLLAEIPPGQLPADLREKLQQETLAVTTAERQEQETQRILLEESLASQWKSANTLLDSQQYDPAIAGFTPLLDTSYDAQAHKKIQEATNLAATAQRKQAASLFIKAVKARSPENKKELLLESRKLLQEVLKKYPQADIIDKVAQNLTTIEQHIAQVDPSLLEDTDEDDMKDAVEGMDVQIIGETL